jgi:threonyl-tRNA synthetase
VTVEKEPLSLTSLRQTAAELLAASVIEIFPDTQLVGGTSHELGFSYDFVFKQPIGSDTIPIIEEKMRFIASEERAVSTQEMVPKNAAAYFRHHSQYLKAEIVEDSIEPLIEIFKMGQFFDDCPGPHVRSSREAGFFKLQEIYTLEEILPIGKLEITRISGVAHSDKASLKKALKSSVSASKRDHRRIAKDLSLFTTEEEAGAGLWFWQPKGAYTRQSLVDWWQTEQKKMLFEPVYTPGIVRSSFLKKSGYFHLPDNGRVAFPSLHLDGQEYLPTPSHAPLHALVFRSGLHSYRELPIRYSECGPLYYQEQNSHLWGMFKARENCVDTASIFCAPSQVLEELISSLQFIVKSVKMHGFGCKLCLRTRGRRFAGTVADWNKYSKILSEAAESCGIDVEREKDGFNGPSLQAYMIDSLGREWKGPRIRVDLNHPERFGLRYQGADDKMHTPVMITRTLFGSLENFVALLIEHYEGCLPLWLAPEQVRIIAITDRYLDYARSIKQKCCENGLRASIDLRSDKLGGKVRNAQCERIPYTIVVGDIEERKELITVRPWNQKEIQKVNLDRLINHLNSEIAAKKNIALEPSQ